MKKLLAVLALLAFLPIAALAQLPGGGGVTVGAPVTGACTNGFVLFNNVGKVGCEAAGGTGTVTSVAVSGGATGLTTSGGPITTTGTITIAGTLAAANGGTGITSLGTGIATFLGTPSSANLAAALTDETGTGAAVFGTSPTLTSLPVVQDVTTTQPGWYAQVTADSVPRIRLGLNATDVASIAMGSGSATRDTFIERSAAANVRHGAPDAAAPVAQTISVQNVVAGTTNTAGANLTIAASQSTGTGTGGSIIFQTSPAVTATGATAQNPLVTVMTINALSSGGTAIPQTIMSNSTSAANPALTFATDTASGIYQRAANTLSYSINGTERWEMLAAITRTRSDMALGWTAGAASAAADTSLSRTGIGVTAFGTGAQGSVAGTFNAATGILNAVATDATHTDATLCADSTTGQLYKGSGTIGICLGTSSARFKTNIVTASDGLREVLALRPVNYFYKQGYGDDGARVQYGLVAEDVVKVLPLLVGLDEEQRPNSVDLVGMIPVLINAIHELKAEVDQLKAVR